MRLFSGHHYVKPSDFAGLTLWLDASVEPTGATTTWSDRSGNGHHGTGTGTNGTNQLNNKNTMHFGGANGFATDNIDWTAVNQYTICTVMRRTGAGSDQAFIEKGDSVYPFVSEGQWWIYETATNRVSTTAYSAGNNYNTRTLSTDDGQAFAVRSLRVDRSLVAASEQNLTRDCGIAYDPVSFGGNAAANGVRNSPFYIGVRGTGAIGLTGDIAEVVVIAQRLSDADLHALEMSLAWKWNLPFRSIMPLGDSITYGNAATDGWRGTLCDVGRIYTPRGSVTLPGTYRNEGHPGHKIADINSNITTWWAAWRAREVLLTIGTNDALTPADRAGMLTAYDTLLTTMDALSPAPTKIWCATLTPLADAPSNAAVDAFNAGLAAVVAGHPLAEAVDVGSSITAADLADGIHPTPDGFLLMGSRWGSLLQGNPVP